MEAHQREFLSLYQKYRYDNQLGFYKDRVAEFKKAQGQAKVGGLVLVVIATLGSGVASFSYGSPLRPISLVIAAIFLILYTALTAYTALYGFELQAKLYGDTTFKLAQAHLISPDLQEGLSEQDFARELRDYVDKVENIYLVEQGQWGQLAERLKPPGV
jgi:hypothetical protein